MKKPVSFFLKCGVRFPTTDGCISAIGRSHPVSGTGAFTSTCNRNANAIHPSPRVIGPLRAPSNCPTDSRARARTSGNPGSRRFDTDPPTRGVLLPEYRPVDGSGHPWSKAYLRQAIVAFKLVSAASRRAFSALPRRRSSVQDAPNAPSSIFSTSSRGKPPAPSDRTTLYPIDRTQWSSSIVFICQAASRASSSFFCLSSGIPMVGSRLALGSRRGYVFIFCPKSIAAERHNPSECHTFAALAA